MDNQKVILVDEIDFALSQSGIASYSELRMTLIAVKEYLNHEKGQVLGATAERLDVLLRSVKQVLEKGS